MNKKIFNSSAIAIIIIGGLIGFYLWKDLTNRPTFSNVPVTRGNVEETLAIDGKVKSQNDSALGFEISGKIAQLTHKTGDRVVAGEILAQLDNQDLKAQYDQAVSLSASAQAILAQDKNLKDQAQYRLKLIEKQEVSLNTKKAQQKQVDAQKNLAASQVAQVAAATANVENAKAQLDKAVLRAPYAGVIAHQDAQEGEVMAIGTSVLTLVDDQNFKIEAEVSQLDIQKIQIGQTAKISFLSTPGTSYDAHVSQIDPVEKDVNGVPNYKVTLMLSNNVSGLESGLTASISMITGSKSGALLVPDSAVFQENGDSFVYVVTNGVREKRKVTTGVRGDNSMTEITSGLNEGDNILVLNNSK